MLRSPSLAALLGTTALFAVGHLPAQAQNLPTGGSVVSGGVAIQGAGNQLTIQQSTGHAIVNWQGFSIGQGARVDIQQPGASSAILNRVTGSTPSTIAGQLNANGQVYLVNPNGIAITSSGTVNAAGFVASSLGITDEDFRSGRRNFTGNGASAAVSNAGTIAIGRGGYAALIGGEVSNSGTISVPMGRVGLGSGEQATLDLSGDGFLQVAVPTQGGGRGALVRNSGTIRAHGGRVELSAATARDAARRAINMSGVIEATEVSGRSGAIVFSGGEGGSVQISGRVDATSATGTGGDVTVTGRSIALRGATIDASGAAGGGRVQVGGARQGGGTLQRAERVRVDSRTTIRADAIRQGHGGDVVIWSDSRTSFAGTITARGGAEGGNGGEVEVSSHGVLGYTGVTDLRAAQGHWGNLLLDPYNITISSGADTGGFTATGNDSVINVTTLQNALGLANVTVFTGTSGAQAGNITVANALSWNTTATLTLQAAGAIAINAGISAGAGGLILNAGGAITATGDVSVARFTLVAGNWVQNSATLPGFATADFQIQGGTFLRATGGDGTIATPYILADIYGVQGVNSLPGSNHYALAHDVDARGTVNWNGGAGFAPIGGFAASFDGRGHVIDGLTINRPTENTVGLFNLTSGTIANLGLTNVSITGLQTVGAVAARLSTGTLDNVYATGVVTGGNSQVGGLVGWSDQGTIRNSWADAAVTGTGEVGGLVGRLRAGTITDVYALGSVTRAGSGTEGVGGLIGSVLSGGNVTNAYASGRVTGSGNVGGLIGSVDGSGITLTGGFWDTETTGQATDGGGATGRTTAQMRSAATYTGFDFNTVWYQAGDMRPILRSEAGTPGMGGVYTVSNLHQLALMGANLNASYRLDRDIDASATAGTNAAGIFGAGGFAPVGSQAAPSASDFDGAGYSIRNLVINRPGENYVGLIGTLDASGSVSNLNLVGGSITGGVAAGAVVGVNNGLISNVTSSATVIATAQAAGGIAGFNNGTIDRSSSSGAISGAGYVGGLVGQNIGTITNAYATGRVTSSGDFAGGLVGLNYGDISQSYATGDVTSTATRVGGIAGYSTQGNIYQVYATGAVTGVDYVGGLVGFLAGATGGVTQAWASGRVTGTGPAPNTGGAFGFAFNAPTVANVYYDTQTTGQSDGAAAGSGAGTTGLSTAQARSPASYAGFDFATDWYQAGDLRPILRSEAAPADGAGVIAIRNVHQLQLMAINSGGSYRLANDIDASETNGTNAAGIFGTGGFVPVATLSGVLDGAGHAISGLTIDRPTTSNVGLFGNLEPGGMIRNISLVGGSVRGFSEVGALVGYSRGTIVDAHSSATVTAEGVYDVGGLVGVNDGGAISGSSATGNVINNNSNGYVGGLVGWLTNGGSVSTSFATGSVTSTTVGASFVGGLVGRVESGSSVSNSFATGAVSGAGQSIGGLVGIIRDPGSSITNAYATGSVTGTATADLIGGLLGDIDGGTVTNAYSTGLVTGPSSARTGGVVGYSNAPDTAFTNVYWDINTSGQAVAQGNGTGLAATGVTTARMQDLFTSRATFAGFDFDTVWVAPNAAGQGGQSGANYPRLRALTDAVVVSGPNATRAYGDANPTFSSIVGFSGLRAGDFVLDAGTYGTNATTASGVGTYGITGSGTRLANASGTSYGLLYTGALTVTPRQITVTADAQSRAYGDANPTLTYTVGGSGLVNGDALSGSLATSATTATGIGGYAITQGTLANANYSITGYTGANLTITPRSLTITADAQSREYGDANPGLTYVVGGGGLVNGDTLSGALATTAGPTSGVGAYAITQGTLAAGPNYAINTYTPANLTVTPRQITVTADAQSRTYGDANPLLTYVVGGGGLVNGDTLSGALATLAGPASGIGSYAITQGSLSGSPNYSITGYTPANLTVTARSITVAADAQSRIYGDANPALTYTVGGGGLVNGDTLSGALATTATTTSGVGDYAITQGTLAASGNYSITGYTPANLTITARGITIAADARSRIYGDANPALTYTVGGGGLVNGDTLSGALATTATTTSGVGDYAITQGTLTASANYAITGYTPASLTVAPRGLTIAADAQSRVYGDANPALTYTIGEGGLVNGDTLSGGLFTPGTAASGVGSYAITQGSLAAGGNYALSFTGANLSILARPLTVTADAQIRQQGDANPALTFVVGGRGLVNGDALTGGLATAADAASAPGFYAITQGSLTGGPNYRLSYVGANLAVLPAVAPVEPVPVFDASLVGSTIDAARRAIQPLPWTQLPIGRGDGTPMAGSADGSVALVVDPRFGGTLLCFGSSDVSCFGR